MRLPLRTARRPGTLAVTVALLILMAEPLLPAVIVVDGTCSLPDAVRAANNNTPWGNCPAGAGDDTIELTADVVLNSIAEVDAGNNGLPTVTSNITIEANGFAIARDLDALSDFRIARVDNTGVLVLENATVSGGKATYGGAFFNDGELTIRGSTLISNAADYLGGAVYNAGSLHALDSLFSTNSANSSAHTVIRGGAVFNLGSFEAVQAAFETNIAGGVFTIPIYAYGGALYDLGSTTIAESTFSGNNVIANHQEGSAIFSSSASFALSNSTVSGNGGLSASAAAVGSVSGQLTNVTLSGNKNYALKSLSGTVVADSTVLANTNGPNCAGTIVGLNSGADDATCGTIPSGLTGLDPVLADNGGPTRTHALLSGSNAIDGAGGCGLVTDQRGAPRVGDCDIGAFEFMGCPVLTLADDLVSSEQTFEECAISAGPDFTVVGPGGDLTLLFGNTAEFGDGFSVEVDGQLTVEHDGSLQLVLEELIEADRARRRELAHQDRPATPADR